ncbi:hypothetical protein Tco_0604287 [Tanacetum coccineum]
MLHVLTADPPTTNQRNQEAKPSKRFLLTCGNSERPTCRPHDIITKSYKVKNGTEAGITGSDAAVKSLE